MAGPRPERSILAVPGAPSKQLLCLTQPEKVPLGQIGWPMMNARQRPANKKGLLSPRRMTAWQEQP